MPDAEWWGGLHPPKTAAPTSPAELQRENAELRRLLHRVRYELTVVRSWYALRTARDLVVKLVDGAIGK